MSLENERWWLIPQSTVDEIKSVIEYARKLQDETCSRTGCICDVADWNCSDVYVHALHSLDSTLNTTSSVPDDFRKSADEDDR